MREMLKSCSILCKFGRPATAIGSWWCLGPDLCPAPRQGGRDLQLPLLRQQHEDLELLLLLLRLHSEGQRPQTGCSRTDDASCGCWLTAAALMETACGKGSFHPKCVQQQRSPLRLGFPALRSTDTDRWQPRGRLCKNLPPASLKLSRGTCPPSRYPPCTLRVGNLSGPGQWTVKTTGRFSPANAKGSPRACIPDMGEAAAGYICKCAKSVCQSEGLASTRTGSCTAGIDRT